MKQNIVTQIIISFFISTTIILILFFTSPISKHNKNGFNRNFTNSLILESKALDIQYNSYYIAGLTSNYIYLGNITGPMHVLIANTFLTDTQAIQIKTNSIEKQKLKAVKIFVDSPNFFILDGISPAILKGNVGNWYASRYMYDSVHFNESMPMSNTSFAISSINDESNQFVLAKETKAAPYIMYASNLTNIKEDNIFLNDGILNYSRESDRIVYINYYRNRFICLDSNLNILYNGKTIDTISKAQIKIVELKSQNTLTMASPPLLVNKKASVSENLIFIQSNLIADNESSKNFRKSAVIDTYSLKDGTYKYSFYLPDYRGNKLKYFSVFNNKIITIYDHYLVKFELNPVYFTNLNKTN